MDICEFLYYLSFGLSKQQCYCFDSHNVMIIRDSSMTWMFVNFVFIFSHIAVSAVVAVIAVLCGVIIAIFFGVVVIFMCASKSKQLHVNFHVCK